MNLELIPIRKMLGMNFFIPKYQRGYRWTKQQVKDLLDDIEEFIQKESNGIYCIQPLVVKECDEKTLSNNELFGTWYEVIDGQQRLTTIYIILKFLKHGKKYHIKYETRKDSEIFLNEIDDKKKDDNIDYYHIVEAKDLINEWFKKKNNDIKKTFLETLLYNVNFIWYQTGENNPIKVFIRLNIGKIALTNAELIKALFLNKSNFDVHNYQKIRLKQQEIAVEWDYIEYTLQNDEFWLFLNKPEYDKPTRIDFIFDLIYKKNILKLDDKERGKIKGKNNVTDKYSTFRYFYFWFRKIKDKDSQCQSENDIAETWEKVKNIFQIFVEWFNDLEFYHYVGFLVEQGVGLTTIIELWQSSKTKDTFLNVLIKKIKEKIKNIDINKQYDVSGSPKTQVRPLLLLHNIQTVINQNKSFTENEKYKLPVFYKFPFHLFKRETWDIEHIAPHTENSLDKEDDRREWLRLSYDFMDDDIKEEIRNYNKTDKNHDNDEKFNELYDKIMAASTDNKLQENIKDENGFIINEKDKLWNFVLLDSSTNRSYGNAIFPAKRRKIIAKDKGKSININEKFEVEEKDGLNAFVPPCTKNVFLKYYNPITNNLREWNKDDAKAYLEDIKNVLSKFLPAKK